MPTAMPEHIRRFAEEHMPPTHELVWLRCKFMAGEPIPRPPHKSELLFERKHVPQDTHAQLLDIDTGEGWSVRLQGVGHDLAPNDWCSLIGHVEKGADRLTRPRLLLNHHTGHFERCFEDVVEMQGKLLSALDYKRTLAFRSPATPQTRLSHLPYKLAGFFSSPLTPARDRARSTVLAALVAFWLALPWWLGPGGLAMGIAQSTALHPWLLALWVPLGLLLMLATTLALTLPLAALGTGLVYFALRLVRIISEPPRFKDQQEYSFAELTGWSNATEWWNSVSVDGTYLYQDVAGELFRFVLHNPDEESGFVVEAVRGRGDKGFLPQREPSHDLQHAA